MIWLNAALAGVVGALLVSGLAMAASIAYIEWINGPSEATGEFAAYWAIDLSILPYLMIGFTLGSWWSLRRQRRTAR